MSNELTHTQQDGQVVSINNPLSRALAMGGHGMNVGAVAIESERAIAEARGQMQLAKMFPRDLQSAYAELMDACKLSALAEVAFYNVPQGGGKVSGPSIRLAEEVARVYGNFEYGHRELSRQEAGPGPKDFGKSEVEVYAWDKEKNNRSIRQITVFHVLDTRDGPRKLRDQKDIDNKIANVASKQVRGRILALMPKWMVEAAIQECRKTLAGNNDVPLSDRVRRMTQAFAKFGVSAEHLENHLGHKLDAILADELVDLQGIFNAIKEGVPPSEYFGAKDDDETKKDDGAAAAISQQVKQSSQEKTDAKPVTNKSSQPKGKAGEADSKPTKEAESNSGKTEAAKPQPEQEAQQPDEPQQAPQQTVDSNIEDDDPF